MEKRKNRNDYFKKYHEKNYINEKKYRVNKNYGVSLLTYQTLLKNQKNSCWICKKKLVETTDKQAKDEDKPHLDHNHITKKVRGVLCHNCNHLIGHSKESIEILKNAIKYIEYYNKKDE